jgi:hypothetical protein
MEAITSFREIPDRSISSDIDRTYKVRRMDPAELYED